MVRGASLLLIGLAACTPAGSGDDTSTDTDTVDSDPTDTTDTVDTDADTTPPNPPPQAALDAVAARLLALPADLRALDVTPVLASMDHVADLWDPACVQFIPRAVGTLYNAACDLDDDVQVFGQTLWQPTLTGTTGSERNAAIDAALARSGLPAAVSTDRAALTGPFVGGDMFARRGATTLMQLNGWFEHNLGRLGDVEVDGLVLDGSVHDADATPDSWVGRDVAPENLTLTAIWFDDGEVAYDVNGAVGGLSGPGTVVDLTAVVWHTAGCADEPDGRIALRDVDGVWTEVTFDGASACDGCGTVEVPGYDAAQVCVAAPDLRTLLGAAP